MVTVIFKLSEAGSVDLAISEPQPLQGILNKAAAQAGIKLGGFIAVRDGQVITAEKRVDVDDVIEVFPAISGG